jgi:hypothetical protein
VARTTTLRRPTPARITPARRSTRRTPSLRSARCKATAYTNCSPTATFTAEAGISDVEAKLFGADGGQGTPLTQFQVVFGFPVTLNLYRSLQAAQGITATTACDGVADGTGSTSQLAGATTGGTAVPNTNIDGVGELDLPGVFCLRRTRLRNL